MNEEQIIAVAKVLAKWNPLGAVAQEVPDLDGYRIEAGDIIFGLKIRGRSLKAEQFVADVLNQAFDLSLDAQSCTPHAKEIVAILRQKGPELHMDTSMNGDYRSGTVQIYDDKAGYGYISPDEPQDKSDRLLVHRRSLRNPDTLLQQANRVIYKAEHDSKKLEEAARLYERGMWGRENCQEYPKRFL